MRESLTPKQIARAIDVSESSVKRWCDCGRLRSERTAGGHRRVHYAEVIRFLRESQHELIRPEVLGLPATTGQSDRVFERAHDQFQRGLVEGDGQRCQRIVFDLYLANHSISRICDQVIAEAFHGIGQRWACGDLEVYQERRGCEIGLRVLHELAKALPSPPDSGPLAMGGTPERDHYGLATTMVELVLRDVGMRAVSLGSGLPLKTLEVAIDQQRPALFWLSVSHLEDGERFLSEYARLYASAGPEIPVAVGGRALTEAVRQRMQYSVYCDTMQHLDAFARTLLSVSRPSLRPSVESSDKL